MGQFEVRMDIVEQLAEREKNIASELNSIGSEMTGILAKIVQYDVASSSIRNRIKSNIEDISEHHNSLKNMSAVLNDCVTEYWQTENRLTVFPSEVNDIFDRASVMASKDDAFDFRNLSTIPPYSLKDYFVFNEGLNPQEILQKLCLGSGLFGGVGAYSKLKEYVESSETLSVLSPGFKDMDLQINSLIENYTSGKDTDEEIQGGLKWLKERWDTFVSNPKDLLEYTGEDVSLPKEMKFAGNLLKYVNIGINTYVSAKDYIEADKVGDSEKQYEAGMDLLDSIGAITKIPVNGLNEITGYPMISPANMLIDYGINMVQNFVTEIRKDDATIGSIYYGMFIDSGLEVICGTAGDILETVGFDIEAVYENLSDKEGYEAIKDVFRQCYNSLEGSINLEGWCDGVKVGVDIIHDGMKSIGNKVKEGFEGVGNYFNRLFN